MGYWTVCDWCGEHLRYDDDQAVMQVTVKHRRGKGTLDSKWAEETKPTLHFCAAAKEDTDRGGRNRMGLEPNEQLDCCYERATAAINGTKLRDPGMGLEWRLIQVEVDEDKNSSPAATPKVPAPRRPMDPDSMVRFGGKNITAELHEFIVLRAASAYKYALPRAGIVSLEQVAAMSEDDLLDLPGVGRGMVKALREWVTARGSYDGMTVAREIYDLLQERVPNLDEDDPVRGVFIEWMPALGEALGVEAA